jgi:hypothetical protein
MPQTLTCVHTHGREQGPSLVTRLLLQVLNLSLERAKTSLTTKERDLERLVNEHTLALEPFQTAATASKTMHRELEQKLRARDAGFEKLRAELQVAPH